VGVERIKVQGQPRQKASKTTILLIPVIPAIRAAYMKGNHSLGLAQANTKILYEKEPKAKRVGGMARW
jgi:hypothetical protein